MVLLIVLSSPQTSSANIKYQMCPNIKKVKIGFVVKFPSKYLIALCHFFYHHWPLDFIIIIFNGAIDKKSKLENNLTFYNNSEIIAYLCRCKEYQGVWVLNNIALWKKIFRFPKLSRKSCNQCHIQQTVVGGSEAIMILRKFTIELFSGPLRIAFFVSMFCLIEKLQKL